MTGIDQPDELDFEREFFDIAAQYQAGEAMIVKREVTKAVAQQALSSVAVVATLALGAKYSLDTSYTPFHYWFR